MVPREKHGPLLTGDRAAGRLAGRDRPRVLALLHLPPPAHGLSLKNQRMVEGEVGRAVDLRVVPLRFARDLEDLGRVSPGKLLAAARVLLRQAVGLLRGVDAGYLSIATEGPGLLRDALFMEVFRLARVPYALHVPTLGLPEGVAGAPWWLRSWVRRRVAGARTVVVLSGAQREEVLRLVGPDRLVVVENGIPDAPMDAPSAGSPHLLFLSNLREAKGIFTLLEAMPILAGRVPEVRLTVAGPWEDAATERRFAETVIRLGLQDRVEHVGPVYDERKLALMRRAGVFVCPSHGENTPNVVLEAMRQGLPIVASRVGGVPEMVADGVVGVLVPPGDARALAEALARLLTDPTTAREMGQRGRRIFEQRFTQDRWEGDIVALLHRLAAGRAAGRARGDGLS